MPRRRSSLPERNELIVRISGYNRTYFVSRTQLENRGVGDEAILEVAGSIERIGKKHKKLLGAPFKATLVCACEYQGDEEQCAPANPALFGVSLKGGCASILAYLPVEPFWALPSMIAANEVTHIEAIYGKPHYGEADLESIHFANSQKLAELEELRQ